MVLWDRAVMGAGGAGSCSGCTPRRFSPISSLFLTTLTRASSAPIPLRFPGDFIGRLAYRGLGPAGRFCISKVCRDNRRVVAVQALGHARPLGCGEPASSREAGQGGAGQGQAPRLGHASEGPTGRL